MLENSLNIQWEVPLPNYVGIHPVQPPLDPFWTCFQITYYPSNVTSFTVTFLGSVLANGCLNQMNSMDWWRKSHTLTWTKQLQHESNNLTPPIFMKNPTKEPVLCHPKSFPQYRFPKSSPCNQSDRPSVPPCKPCRQRSEISLWGHHGCRLNETWCLGRSWENQKHLALELSD